MYSIKNLHFALNNLLRYDNVRKINKICLLITITLVSLFSSQTYCLVLCFALKVCFWNKSVIKGIDYIAWNVLRKGGLTGYPMMLFGELYYQRNAVRAVIFNMDAIDEPVDEHVIQADIFKDCNIVYLHCVDKQNPVQFKIKGLPFLSLQSYFCHFSFVNSLTESRIAKSFSKNWKASRLPVLYAYLQVYLSW